MNYSDYVTKQQEQAELYVDSCPTTTTQIIIFEADPTGEQQAIEVDKFTEFSLLSVDEAIKVINQDTTYRVMTDKEGGCNELEYQDGFCRIVHLTVWRKI